MKSLFSLLLIFATLSFFNGCTVNKDFSLSIEKELDVNNFPSKTYSKSDTLDAKKSSSDYAKYKADMKSLDIQSATYTVLSSSGSATQKIVTGTLTISSADGSVMKTISTVSDVTLQAVLGVAQPLTLTADGKQFLQDQLLGSTSSAVLTFSGTTNEAPITFAVKFHFDVKATYSKTLP